MLNLNFGCKDRHYLLDGNAFSAENQIFTKFLDRLNITP